MGGKHRVPAAEAWLACITLSTAQVVMDKVITNEVQHDVIGAVEKLLKNTRQVPNVSCWTPAAGTVKLGAVGKHSAVKITR